MRTDTANSIQGNTSRDCSFSSSGTTSVLKSSDCTFVNDSAKALLDHKRNVHNWVQTPKIQISSKKDTVKCSECNYGCNTNKGLNRHVNAAHPGFKAKK